MRHFIFLLLLLFALPLWAETTDGLSSAIKKSGLPVPRWATLRGDTVNMRVGPGARYPISWVYARKGMPVEIIAEFDIWRKVRDIDGATGWMQQATLSGKRAAIIIGKEWQPMYKSADETSELRAQLYPGVIAKIIKCENDWCKLEAKNGKETRKGYMKKAALFGVYPDEKVE